MTFVSYELANGTIVKSMPEAKASGQTYKQIFTEDRFAELYPEELTPEQIEARERRFKILAEKYPGLN